MQVSLPELLQSYGLPKGLFPKNATHYELDETGGKLTVFLASSCEVGFKDGSLVRYAKIVTTSISQGRFMDIQGMKTKLLLWVNVTSITVDDPTTNKLYFGVGLKKSRPLDAYEVLREGFEIDGF